MSFNTAVTLSTIWIIFILAIILFLGIVVRDPFAQKVRVRRIRIRTAIYWGLVWGSMLAALLFVPLGLLFANTPFMPLIVIALMLGIFLWGLHMGILALVYNAVASLTGGIEIDLLPSVDSPTEDRPNYKDYSWRKIQERRAAQKHGV